MQIQISWLLQKPTDLDLHSLLRQGMSCSAREGLNRTLRICFLHILFREYTCIVLISVQFLEFCLCPIRAWLIPDFFCAQSELCLTDLRFSRHYRIYPKYSDTSTPYHICSKISTSTIHYPMLCLKIPG